MKNILFIVIIACFGILGCGEKTSDTEKEANTTLETETATNMTSSTEEIKSCEDFLNTYEKWTDDLIELMAAHKDDPVGLATSQEYINTMMQGVNFTQDWATISVSCSMNKSYETRMKAIQEHMEKKQVELGLK
ncbi:MAG: hypothetical protein AAF489_08330 [Bacteroidota bacterium]